VVLKEARGLAGFSFHEIQSIKVLEYCPTSDASGEASEVHLVLRMRGVPRPLILRATSPHHIDDLVSALVTYRAAVWPQPKG
jgi:hypothetical protein